jgi:hypothetical protein
MVRKLFGVLCVATVLCVGAILADEITGAITKVDVTKKTVTVKDKDGKEMTYDLDTGAKITLRGGKGGEPPPGTLENLQKAVEKAADAGRGFNATLTRDDKTKKITEIKAGGRGKGKGGI